MNTCVPLVRSGNRRFKYYVMEAAIVETRSSPARRIVVSFNGRTVPMSVAGLAGFITGEI